MASSINASLTAGIVQTADTSGNLNLQSGGTTIVAITSSGAAVTGLLEGSTNYTGFKNRIINGGMVIDQRYAGASGAVTGAAYVVDRWRIIRVGGTSTLTCGQSSTAPTGLTNSFLVTAGSGATPATTEERSLSQPIEGFNVSDLGWGAAGAQSITISFWVQSSVTGTYGLLLGNGAGNRGYVASYTINAANTWEYKTVTVAGDTSGTWLKTNGNGLTIYWDLGTGPTYSGAVTGAWQASYFEGLTGGTKLSATSGATFYITGVQLEKGSTATSFDYRPYGTELSLCQRYYLQKDIPTGYYYSIGYCHTTTEAYIDDKFTVTMRTSPTFASAGTFGILKTSVALTVTGIVFGNAQAWGARFYASVASGLTGGQACELYSTGTSNINYSAEL